MRQELKSEPLEKKITDMIIGSCKAFEVYTRVHPKPLQKAEAEAEAEAEPERHACMAGVVTCIYAQCFGSLL